MPHALVAQAVPGIVFQGENDGLDLWLPKIKRPDGEYTSGLRVSITRSVAPLWGRFVHDAKPCSGSEVASQRCLTTEFAIAQQMYTPFNAENNPRPIDRPFAGWLHADVTADVVSTSRLRSLKLTAGFTGRATLAEALQKAFHRAVGISTADGWQYQLGFRPAASLTYVEKIRAVLATLRGRAIIDAQPSWSVQAGNSRTDAYAEMTARLGYHLSHPWNLASRVREGAHSFGIWVYGGVRGTFVAYDQTLDRSWSRHDITYSVQRVPWVGSYQFGVAARRHSLTVSFGGVHDEREYTTEFAPHSYGSLTVTVDRLAH